MKLSIRVTVTVALVFLANVHTGGMTEYMYSRYEFTVFQLFRCLVQLLSVDCPGTLMLP